MAVNGWYPRLNKNGDVCSGSGEIYVNGTHLANGWMPHWYATDVVLFKGADDTPYLLDLTVQPPVPQQLSTVPCVYVAAGGGVWFASDFNVGRIHVGVSQDGKKTWVTEYNGNNNDHSVFIEQASKPFVLAEHQPINGSRLEGGYATWTYLGGPRGTEVWGRAPNRPAQLLQTSRSGELAGVPILTPHGPCVLLQTQTDLRIVKWGTTIGLIIATGNDQNLNPDAIWHDATEQIMVVCNNNEGILHTFAVTYDELVNDVLDPVPPKPEPIPIEDVEPMVGDNLMAWYEQRGNVPRELLPPGNAQIAVRGQTGVQLRPSIVCGAFDDPDAPVNTIPREQIIGYRIGTEGLEGDQVLSLERQAAAASARGYRPFVYWDGRRPPRYPTLPMGSVWEQNAYCGVSEALNAFESDLDACLWDAVHHYQYVLITCQSFNTNNALLEEPSLAIPPVMRLWERYHTPVAPGCGIVIGLTCFNNSGRDNTNPDSPGYGEGGLTANPQLRPHWERVFSGVTGLPELDVEPVPPEPGPEPPEPEPGPEPPPEDDMKVALSQPSYINWRWGGGQSLEPPTNADDPNREAFEYDRPQAGGDEWVDLIPQGDYYAVRSPNGRSWLSVQIDGSLEERDAQHEPGEWELFTLTHDGLIVEKAKEGVTRPPQEFLV
jgi:hypothetical protein